jgi:hypothetical protein
MQRSASLPSLSPSFARLEELGALVHDWDSYGAAPITARALRAARKFFQTVIERFGPSAGDAALPRDISPIPSGGVLAEWVGPSAEIEIHIGPGGKLGYLFIDRRGAEPQFDEGDEISLDRALALVGEALKPEPAERR